GLCVLDRRRRLVVANTSYGRTYGLTDRHLAPGRPLADLIDAHLTTAGCAPIDATRFRAFRLADADSAGARRAVITLA
ncbi:PAS-domain containing protein, partial [Klebsiella pneumoniae]|uniref:PAS-domain containing protein n=1 Tax=Klebsiella pneumoniae TaxID=573 RepID=UPI003724BAEB